MEEVKDGRILPTESSPVESIISNSESPVTAVDEKYEVHKQSMKTENSAISDVQYNSDGLSLEQSPYIPEEGSSETGRRAESVATSLSEVKNIEAPNSLDNLKMDVKTISNEPENGTSVGVTHTESNDVVAVTSKIKSADGFNETGTKSESIASSLSEVKDKEEPSLSEVKYEAPNSLDSSKMEVEIITNNSDNGMTSTVTNVESNDDFDVSSEIKSSEDTSQYLPSHELNHSEVVEVTPKKSPASATSTEQDTSIMSPDGSTGMRPVVDHSTTSLSVVKDITKPDSSNNEQVQIKDDVNRSEISNKSENGISVDNTDGQSNYEDNVSNEIESCEDMPRSLPSNELGNSQVEDGTPTKFLASTKSSTQVKNVKTNRGLVDTAAPFESVKEAVTKFGGIVDWKAHKSKTLERQKYVQSELEITQEEIPRYKNQTEAAEHAKGQVLEELESTKRLIEELKLSLEKAQTEEAQAKQDSELAQLRVKEMEQGIASEASVAAKEQLNVARTRYAAAVADLKSVKDELKLIQEEYVSLVNERDLAITRAEEASSASKEFEKTVEDLTLELITAREALESAHTAHMEAEEHRIGAALARDQDSLNWEKELKQAEDELQQLNEKLLSAKDLQLKLDTASALLLNLKCELAAYMEAKLNQESESISKDNQKGETAEAKETHASILAEVASTKKELEEVEGKIEKAREEVDFLKVAAVSLKTEFEAERAALATMRQREGMVSIAVSSLEAELNRTKMEIEQVQMREKEVQEQMVEMPKALQQAAREADEAKSLAQSAQEELKKEKEESEQAKASSSTMESRLHAALKEIEATKASERLALAAIKALQESEQASELTLDDSHTGVTLPLEEYYELSKRAHDAEEQAGERVAAAISQIEVAKESEARSLEALELANIEMVEKKEALRLATERAEKAKEGKLGVEQELRTWRAENERRRKAADASQVAPSHPPRRSFGDSQEPNVHFTAQAAAVNYAQSTAPDSNMYTHESSTDNVAPEVKTKKKKSLFPRIVMLLARKKAAGT